MTINTFSSVNAYAGKPFGLDARRKNGAYTPNVIQQQGLINSYDPANPECYVSGTSIKDLTGNNSLTITGGMESTYYPLGYFDNDGVNDGATGSNANLPTGDITIAGWAYVRSGAVGVVNTFLFGYYDSSGSEYFLIRYNGGIANAFELVMKWGSSGTPGQVRANNVTVAADRWYYIAGTFNDTTKDARIIVYEGSELQDRTLNRSQIDRSVVASPAPFLAGTSSYIAPSGVGEWHSHSSLLSKTQIAKHWENTKKRYGY